MNAERFWAKVDKTDTCWLWTGATNSRGYGCFGVNGKSHLVHRLAYESEVGPIPDGLTIDHVRERGCASKLCVNPVHLEAVTRAENVRRHARTIQACRNCGGPLTLKRSTGKRRCQSCENRRAREKSRSALQHGTNSGFASHRRRHERPCDACLAAHEQAVASGEYCRRAAA